MRKLHLRAQAPNEGARLAAQWIIRECFGSVEQAAVDWQTSVTNIDRMIDGSIIPGEYLVEIVSRGTRGVITRRDWRTPACGSWAEDALTERTHVLRAWAA